MACLGFASRSSADTKGIEIVANQKVQVTSRSARNLTFAVGTRPMTKKEMLIRKMGQRVTFVAPLGVLLMGLSIYAQLHGKPSIGFWVAIYATAVVGSICMLLNIWFAIKCPDCRRRIGVAVFLWCNPQWGPQCCPRCGSDFGAEWKQ